jgi:hypothetical protein
MKPMRIHNTDFKIPYFIGHWKRHEYEASNFVTGIVLNGYFLVNYGYHMNGTHGDGKVPNCLEWCAAFLPLVRSVVHVQYISFQCQNIIVPFLTNNTGNGSGTPGAKHNIMSIS